MKTKQAYKLFLQSDFWRNLRNQRLRIAGYQCERIYSGYRCEANRFLQVHHKVYRPSWFDTRIEDLVVLCDHCHATTHGRTPQRPHFVPVRQKLEILKDHTSRPFIRGMYETGPADTSGKQMIAKHHAARQRRLALRALRKTTLKPV